jgi:hypothetical protein
MPRCMQSGTYFNNTRQQCEPIPQAQTETTSQTIQQSTSPADYTVLVDNSQNPASNIPSSDLSVSYKDADYNPNYQPPIKSSTDITSGGANPAVTTPTAPATKDNTMLYVGGGLAVLALLGGVYYLSTRKK